ncbi:MAG: FAD-dependent oxidoreductase [Gammaproteobacteria bacterium]|nr:FAD-dependent oxidoreductase [Gammaproteobacteria bacterium]
MNDTSTQPSHRVTIVGAGVAGLTAALKLVERGFRVDIYEKATDTVDDDHGTVGGNYGGHFKRTYAHGSPGDANDDVAQEVSDDGDRAIFHEHSYHMLPAWYENFFQLAADINAGSGDSNPIEFEDRPTFVYIDTSGKRSTISNLGDARTHLSNLLRGPVSPVDMSLGMYTLLALLAPDPFASQSRERISVNGFVYSRWWSNNSVTDLQQKVLAKAFASPVYRSSAETYRSFIAYGAAKPTPMTRVLRGDSFHSFIKPLCEAIERSPLATIHRGESICKLELADGPSHRVVGIVGDEHTDIEGDVIMALSPSAWAELIDDDIATADPKLARIRQLEYLPMASLDLYLDRKVAGMPSEFVILENSAYGLTFIDNSQAWGGVGNTFLNVVASSLNDPDSDHPFDQVLPPQELQHIERELIVKILAELNAHLTPSYGITIEKDWIDWKRTWLNRNHKRALFLNQVGTWRLRPDTTCAISNLYLAGAFCRNATDVETLEGAVTSGLLAAEAIRQKHGCPEPVQIHDLKRLAPETSAVLHTAWLPMAVAAKAWSMIATPFQGLAESVWSDSTSKTPPRERG